MRTPPEGGSVGLLAALALLTAFAGCTGGLMAGGRTTPAPSAAQPVSASALVLSDYLLLLQRLAQGSASEQAEIVASARNEYGTAPTPSRELKLALVLATPGHPATDLPQAQGLLRELMAHPESLLPAERALAFLELSQIDDHLTLAAENRRLQTDAVREDQTRMASANRRLQAELDENAKLRKELEEAHAKLDAIANIERSLNERKPGTTTPHP
jgi:molybdopterin-biosynthesis enzyme MoeA-like protein